MQSSDRIVLSSTASIYEFAQYSLAASTMMVPVTLIAAIARVFFPHLAATERKRHPEIYGQASGLIVMAWSLLLPYYFVVDLFVRHFLPNYVGILPVAGILLLGALFLAVIQILHGSVFNLYGKQKYFLLYAILAFAISLGLVAMAARCLPVASTRGRHAGRGCGSVVAVKCRETQCYHGRIMA